MVTREHLRVTAPIGELAWDCEHGLRA